MNTSNRTKSVSKQPQAIQMLTSDSVKNQIQMALPASVRKYLDPDRMVRIAMTEFRKTPMLAKCEAKSIVGAIIQAAQMGLEPGGLLGHCYLVPYKNKATGTVNCQLIVGYRGMLSLSRRSGEIEQINAYVVRESDVFNYQLGLEPKIEHIPDDETPPDPTGKDITYVYAIARLKGGGIQFEIMPITKVRAIRARSAAGKTGPWATDFEEMARKTAIRRLFKFLPVSLEVQRAVSADEQSDTDIQDNASFIDDVPYDVVNDIEDNIETPSMAGANQSQDGAQ